MRPSLAGIGASLLLGCAAAAPAANAQLVAPEPVAKIQRGAWAQIVGNVRDVGLPDLTGGVIVSIDVPVAPNEPIQVSIPDEQGREMHLLLEPNSLRSEIYALREQLADGSIRIVADPGPECTFTGTVDGVEDSAVAASMTGEGLFAAVFLPDGSRRWVQPLSDFLPGTPRELHVVYTSDDTLCDGVCGMPDPGPAAQPAPGGYTPRGTCGGGTCVAQLACDADFEYFTARGSSSHATQDRIFAIINVMNHQYVREVAITHTITTVLVRTAEPDPYSSNVSDTLMCQMITEWTDNQTAVTRDLTKLFTGRDISGATVGQAANFGQICDNSGFCTAGLDNGAYCYSQSDFSATFACQTDVAAHQVGHLWGAHDCSCPSSTMNTTIACVNTFNNAGGVPLSEIDAHADAVACLASLTPPSNDTCDDATLLPGTGTYQGTNSSATTDGGALNCGSLSGNVGGGRNDVFFRIAAVANGTATIDLCGSNFDTMMSIHTGCPATPTNQMTCNDDCGGSPCACCDSCLSFAATAGTTYYVRVAGYAGATGSITLNVGGPFTPGNNSCSNAFAVAADASISGSIAHATNDGSASCGSSSSNPDVWYTFTAGTCGGTLVIDTCGTHDRLGVDTGMDTVLSIHSACPGTTGNQLACDDDDQSCPGASGLQRDSRVSAPLTPNQQVFIRVSHFSTAIDDGFFFLNVDFTPGQVPPVVNPIGNTSHNCGDLYLGPTPSITNPPCMSPVTWSLVAAPSGMAIDPATGVVSWPNPTLAAAPHVVTIRATNSEGFDDETWTITVNPVAPVIVPIANVTRTCGVPYIGPTPVLVGGSCVGSATWTLTLGPPGMTINPSTGVVTWTDPTIGTHSVTIVATNAAGSDAESWQIVVDPAAPIIIQQSNETFACVERYTGPTPRLTDPACMEPVVWSLVDGPLGVTINSATGVVSWATPSIGTFQVEIRATNGEGFDAMDWLIRFGDSNPSILTNPSPESVGLGQPASFSVTASANASAFQWQRNLVNITPGTPRFSGINSPTLTIDPALAADAGSYRCVVSNNCGSRFSLGASLTVDPCGSADFDCDGDSGTDADIEAFFACLAGNCPPPPCTSSADFDGDGDSGTDADIEAFFRVLAGGTC